MLVLVLEGHNAQCSNSELILVVDLSNTDTNNQHQL